MDGHEKGLHSGQCADLETELPGRSVQRDGLCLMAVSRLTGSAETEVKAMNMHCQCV